jgi:polyhydroxyalkanoate synthase subunit PhaC
MRLLSSAGKPAQDKDFVVGKTVAASRGKVVFRNDLIELIQYYPTTGRVHPQFARAVDYILADQEFLREISI